MRFYFEGGGEFIAARNVNGDVLIRCNLSLTDCGESESLDAFVFRHGGPEECEKYLRQMYSSK